MAKKEKPPVVKMTKEEILASIQIFPNETKLKAWTFQVDNKCYHVAEFGGVYKVPVQTSLWEANKKGKRLTEKPLISIFAHDHKKCINIFLESLEEAKIEAEIEAESKIVTVEESVKETSTEETSTETEA